MAGNTWLVSFWELPSCTTIDKRWNKNDVSYLLLVISDMLSFFLNEKRCLDDWSMCLSRFPSLVNFGGIWDEKAIMYHNIINLPKNLEMMYGFKMFKCYNSVLNVCIYSLIFTKRTKFLKWLMLSLLFWDAAELQIYRKFIFLLNYIDNEAKTVEIVQQKDGCSDSPLWVEGLHGCFTTEVTISWAMCVPMLCLKLKSQSQVSFHAWNYYFLLSSS